MTPKPICPCGGFVHPATIFNPPGLATIRYRMGDYITFREALLQPLPNEQALTLWRPGASGDLAVQLLEWWAYVADVLTFYDERVANQQYLRTADLEESARRIVRILGYRPRPGIGATGQVAALVKGPKPIVVPAGYQIQSKPGPGQQPQTFEVDQPVTAGLPDRVDADPPPNGAVTSGILLAGQNPTATPGEVLLVVNRGWAAASTDFAAFVTVASVSLEADPRGVKNTRIAFTTAIAPAQAAPGLRILRSGNSIGLWAFNGAIFSSNTVHLASLARDIQVGDIVAFDEGGSSPSLTAVLAVSNSEKVWFANTPDPDVPVADKVLIPIPHTVLGFSGTVDTADLTTNRSVTRLRYLWRDVGTPIAVPASSASGTPLALTPAPGAAFPLLPAGATVLLEDGQGDGVAGAVVSSSAAALSVTPTVPSVLRAPLDVLFNVLNVSRGKTVPNEVLGSGDATVAGQEFTLKKSPLTYLASADPSTAEGYKSTLRVWADGVEWHEASSFYGAAPDDKIFVTKEDENQKTHVQFGDGVRGARLPAGTNNVTASYRYESGAELPDTGKLTVMLKPLPGLKGIVNPVQPFGGSDPDLAARLRQLAPKSVLTFGRAVSGADYEAIAAATPGVVRAKAYWSFNTERQQTTVTVLVGDTPGAVTAAQQALARSADPNRPLIVQQALPLPIRLRVDALLLPGYRSVDVLPALIAALDDPDAGLLGKNVVRIGQTLFRSQIFAACLAVTGVASVELLLLRRKSFSFNLLNGYKAFAGEGRFFQLDPADLVVNLQEAPNA
ncbi:MAG: hypothetical protein ABI759_28595 [Candidatus Solibacter sp.]